MLVGLVPRRLRSFPHVREHNWLNHELIVTFLSESAKRYAHGILVDIGCGQKPYEPVFAPYVSQHIGLDLCGSAQGTPNLDIIGSAYDTGLRDATCGIILCSEVLEHLEEPRVAIREMNRILKPRGCVILTVPFFWPVHEEPRDFYRYSEHGLRYLFEETGFQIVEIKPLSGYIVTFAQMSIYFFMQFQRGFLLRSLGRIFNWGAQHLALTFNKYDRSTRFTNLYGLVAQKTEHGSIRK